MSRSLVYPPADSNQPSGGTIGLIMVLAIPRWLGSSIFTSILYLLITQNLKRSLQTSIPISVGDNLFKCLFIIAPSYILKCESHNWRALSSSQPGPRAGGRTQQSALQQLEIGGGQVLSTAIPGPWLHSLAIHPRAAFVFRNLRNQWSENIKLTG